MRAPLAGPRRGTALATAKIPFPGIVQTQTQLPCTGLYSRRKRSFLLRDCILSGVQKSWDRLYFDYAPEKEIYSVRTRILPMVHVLIFNSEFRKEKYTRVIWFDCLLVALRLTVITKRDKGRNDSDEKKSFSAKTSRFQLQFIVSRR